ncbi:MAG: response regulator transcription factor [Elusimicrobia bacterium]|nr:response regulator transcription factor [Elusimicrobiota bacterium]
MIVFSIDEAWLKRLRALAASRGWEFDARAALPGAADAPSESPLAVVDRALAGTAPARAVAALRAAHPGARVALACGDDELGVDGVAAALASGADEALAKSWPDARLLERLSSLRDAALADAVLESEDGTLRAERRSRRVFVRARGRRRELALPAAEFALLWRLLAARGAGVSRECLLEALAASSGREVEAETVARRVLSLRRALAPWTAGRVETLRGGYRLASSRRRSTT